LASAALLTMGTITPEAPAGVHDHSRLVPRDAHDDSAPRGPDGLQEWDDVSGSRRSMLRVDTEPIEPRAREEFGAE
jgi:hypothetical protein